MTCEELAQLLPDLVDGILSPQVRAEAEAILPNCPDCQREFEIARRVRALFVALQAEHPELRVSANFQARLMQQIHRQSGGLELLDLSSKAFGIWLVELINLIGGLLDPHFSQQAASQGAEPASA